MTRAQAEPFDPAAAEICRLQDKLRETVRENGVLRDERQRARTRVKELERELLLLRPVRP